MLLRKIFNTSTTLLQTFNKFREKYRDFKHDVRLAKSLISEADIKPCSHEYLSSGKDLDNSVFRCSKCGMIQKYKKSIF